MVYINDMPGVLEKTTPCLYADDTQIHSSSHDYDTLVKNLNMDSNNTPPPHLAADVISIQTSGGGSN